MPGTIIVSCSVCGTRYQKRLDCEFFQCENCHALVTHSTNGFAPHPPSSFAPSPPNVTVHVNTQASESPAKKKKKKKKKQSRNSSSSESDSSSSSSSGSRGKRKRSSQKVKKLEKQVKELQKNAGYVGTTDEEWPQPQPWPQAWDSSPVSSAAHWGAPQLMDSPFRSNSWSSGSPMSGGYANQNKAFVNSGNSPGNSNWGAWPSSPANFNSGNSPSTWGNPPSNSWVAPQSPAQNSWRPPMTQFGNPFGQTPQQITVNIPSDVASMSSDQLMMLANAKKSMEEQDGKKPLNLQILPGNERRTSQQGTDSVGNLTNWRS